MNGRRTPKHIFNAHPPDQCSQIGTDLRASSQVSRFATPVAAKTGTMPAHQGLGPDDRDRLENRWKPAIQLDEAQAIAVRELDPTSHLALLHNQLLPQRGVLYFKLALGLEERGNQVQEQDYQRGRSRTRSESSWSRPWPPVRNGCRPRQSQSLDDEPDRPPRPAAGRIDGIQSPDCAFDIANFGQSLGERIGHILCLTRLPGAETTNRRYRWLLRVRRERPRRRTERAEKFTPPHHQA
jgi:hypothetical protein